MKRNFFLMIVPLLLALWIIQCTQKSEYELRVERELASGVRADSLFLGYHFGMSKKAFMDHSWQLNKEGVIAGYATIGHTFTELPHPALMEFFPEFDENGIVRMPVTMEYRGWAPWNEHLSPEVLIKDLVQLYESKYGERFDVMPNETTGDSVYVSIRGNRLIRVYKESVSEVMLEFSDLSTVAGS